MNHERHVLSRFDLIAFESGDVESFRAVEIQRLGVRAFFELARKHAHADEVAAMDALETLRDDGAHA